jgi:predicted nucleotidyltransferase
MDKFFEKLEKIVKVLSENLKPKKIILFGSRAKGNNCNGSDIDLCVVGAKELDKRNLRKLKEKIDDISGLYSVDLIFYEKIDEEFKKIILETGKVIYEKK